jgi:hypothetical protein
MLLGGESLPFDVAGQRTIQFDCHDLDSVDAAKEELAKQISAVEKDPTQVDSPVSMAIDLSALQQRSKPEDTTLLQAISLLQEIKLEQRDIHSKIGKILGEGTATANDLVITPGAGALMFERTPVSFLTPRASTILTGSHASTLGFGTRAPIKPKETPPEK